MAGPYQPSEQKRSDAPPAFEYELNMLRFAIEQHSRIQGLSDVLLECALLHARNLLEFFCQDEPPVKDTICAGHFVGDSVKNNAGNWWKSCKLPYLQSIRVPIHKALSHLTYHRIGAEYEWDLAKIKNEVEAAYSEFFSLLPEEDKPKWPSPKA